MLHLTDHGASGRQERVVYLDALEDDPSLEQPAMRFRLTYDGPLKATQQEAFDGQRNRLAEHKHSIRRHFHRQLEQLWGTNRFLRDNKVRVYDGNVEPDAVFGGYVRSDECEIISLREAVARNYLEVGYRFVPLVREQLSLLCSLDILFLRNDYPGGIISAGDLDNRIKTLIDTLRMPRHANELRGNETPGDGEDPFFCLLEDDKAVTRLVVETDTLLEPKIGLEEDVSRHVKLVINVEIKPYDVRMANLNFA